MTTGLLILSLILLRRQRTDIRNLLSRLVADRDRAWPAIKILADLMADIANASAHSGDSVHLLAKRLDLIFNASSGESRTFKEAFYILSDVCNAGTLTNLASRFPELTQTELALCAMILLGLDPACICRVMGYDSDQTFYNRRTDIRKKMGLDRSASLEGFLNDESLHRQLVHQAYLEALLKRY